LVRRRAQVALVEPIREAGMDDSILATTENATPPPSIA
jgi:hypothetical protein